jgi:hypothetical protein
MLQSLIQIALILIIARSGYRAFTCMQKLRKPWLDLLHYISVAVVALGFLIR